jgi:fumarate reductase subunit C
MPVQLGENKLPDRAIVIGHYAAWAAVTLFIFRLAGVL